MQVGWVKREVGRISYRTAGCLQSTGFVIHGFSSRHGGISPLPFDSLNLSLAAGDRRENVIANRAIFAGVLGVDPKSLVAANQTHSANVHRVTRADAGRGAVDHDTSIRDTDALITDEPGITLALTFADCACVFLVDPVNRAIGAVHAGWRGTVLGTVTAAVNAMAREFHTRADNLLAAVGPCICPDCYEVGDDVAQEAIREFGDENCVIQPLRPGKWRFDIRKANLILLERAGVHRENTAVSDECTCCSADEFFSYRRDGTTGRMGGWIAIKDQSRV